MLLFFFLIVGSFILAVLSIPIFGFSSFIIIFFACLIALAAVSISNSSDKNHSQNLDSNGNRKHTHSDNDFNVNRGDDPPRACPYCSEKISAFARKCKHCKSPIRPIYVLDPEYDMRCPNCTKIIDVDAAFCEYCNCNIS